MLEPVGSDLRKVTAEDDIGGGPKSDGRQL